MTGKTESRYMKIRPEIQELKDLNMGIKEASYLGNKTGLEFRKTPK